MLGLWELTAWRILADHSEKSVEPVHLPMGVVIRSKGKCDSDIITQFSTQPQIS